MHKDILHASKLMCMYVYMLVTARIESLFTACHQLLQRAAQLWPQCKWDLRDPCNRSNRITVRSHYATQVLEFSCNPIMLGENRKQHNSFSKVSWGMVLRSYTELLCTSCALKVQAGGTWKFDYSSSLPVVSGLVWRVSAGIELWRAADSERKDSVIGSLGVRVVLYGW